MSSHEQEMSSHEPVLGYSELLDFLAVHLGWQPSKAVVSKWMNQILDLPPYQRGKARQFPLSDAMALVFWGRAGELAKKGSPRTRAQRRNTLFLEAYEQWQSNQQKTSKTAIPALVKVSAA